MPAIAISGHRGLQPFTADLIDQAMRVALNTYGRDIIGWSCLADGADQLFARAVLDHGGNLEAIVPAVQYRAGLPTDAQAEYDRLLAAAAHIHQLPFPDSDSQAYMAASAHMIEHADELWAVWDGKPARAYGGTADVVRLAREHDLPVSIIWPSGAQRD